MSCGAKLVRLRGLLCRIERCFKCYDRFRDYPVEDRVLIREWCHEGPWFYPPHEETGVKGFFGTGRVMFVAERPSTRGGKVPDNLDIEFFKLLRKFNLQDSHITDLIKCRGTVKEAKCPEEWDRRVENCLPFLLEEIKIIKPVVIVAVGRRVYKELKRRGLTENFKTKRITHYSYAFSAIGRNRGADQRLCKEIEEISKIINGLE